MIAVRCSNCGKKQQLETAFAGCICRCRYCAAIQTVPANAPRVDPGASGPWRTPRGTTLMRAGDIEPVAAPPRTGRKGAARGHPKAGARRGPDVTLIAVVAVAALLTIGAAIGAIAWIQSASVGP